MSKLGNSAATIRDYDNRHYLHPWDAMWLRGEADRTTSARAEGIYVYDPTGKRLIDGPGGMWCSQTGYGRREMADAIAEQVLPHINRLRNNEDTRQVTEFRTCVILFPGRFTPDEQSAWCLSPGRGAVAVSPNKSGGHQPCLQPSNAHISSAS